MLVCRSESTQTSQRGFHIAAAGWSHGFPRSYPHRREIEVPRRTGFSLPGADTNGSKQRRTRGRHSVLDMAMPPWRRSPLRVRCRASRSSGSARGRQLTVDGLDRGYETDVTGRHDHGARISRPSNVRPCGGTRGPWLRPRGRVPTPRPCRPATCADSGRNVVETEPPRSTYRAMSSFGAPVGAVNTDPCQPRF